MKVFEPRPFRIPEDRLLRMQGYRQPDAVRRAIRKAAAAAARLAETLVEPRVYYQGVPISNCGSGRLELGNGLNFNCEAFGKYLSACTDVVIFIQSIGQRFDDHINELMEHDDLLGVLFLDNAGWLAIEASSRSFAGYLRSTAAAGGGITRRLGPGYRYRANRVVSEWPLREQQILFQVFAGDPIPVTLLDSSAMLPRMSRSGLYGMYSSASRSAREA